MEIKEAINKIEKYIEGIIKYPDPYNDPDIDALQSLIEFAKSKI